MHLLLIEDDFLIGDGLKAGLPRLGFSLDWFRDGQEGHEAIQAKDYDAVILDLTLPGMDGLEILKSWRAAGRTEPVLILTARGALDQRIDGLNRGADDYLGKPFSLEELGARLRALVRRSHGTPVPELKHGDVCFSPDRRMVTKAGVEVPMSPTEVRLVELFLLNRKTVLSKASIEEKLYPWGEEVSSNAVEVHVHHIRKKLGSGFIRTVHGLGYALGDQG